MRVMINVNNNDMDCAVFRCSFHIVACEQWHNVGVCLSVDQVC